MTENSKSTKRSGNEGRQPARTQNKTSINQPIYCIVFLLLLQVGDACSTDSLVLGTTLFLNLILALANIANISFVVGNLYHGKFLPATLDCFPQVLEGNLSLFYFEKCDKQQHRIFF